MNFTMPGLSRLCLLAFLVAVFPGAARAETPAPDAAERQDVYRYRMKGKVRLLFFWVGKDDVGGGHIAISRKPEPEKQSWRQEIEVLFGSNPERVPGKINRWGYGRETARWSASPEPSLVQTVFEGFMKHSREESLSEVRSNDGAQQASQNFVYDGIRSVVGGIEATSEIRFFSSDEDFDYRDPGPIHCGYRERLQAGPADKSRRLAREQSAAPFGFLTAVNHVIQTVLKEFDAGRRWKGMRPSHIYVYNAQKYRLDLKKLKLEDKFDLPLPDIKGRSERSRRFTEVLKAEFKISKLGTDYDHDFNIWFPVRGQYRGVPIRIEDKPRWWLRIELNLDPTADSSKTRAQLAADRLASCR